MSNELKITFTGGSELLGETVSVEPSSPVFVGRSHSAAIRFTERDSDVSRRHVEIRFEAGGTVAVALRPFVLNERDKVGECEMRKLSKGDVLTLGMKSRAGIRIDAVPSDVVVADDAPTGETKFTDATMATGTTGATLPYDDATDATIPAGATGATIPADATSATLLADGANFEPPGASDTITSELPASATQTLNSTDDPSTVLLPGAVETVVIDQKLIPKIDIDAPKRLRRRFMLFAILGAAALLGAVMYSRMNHSAEFLSHASPTESTTFKDSTGRLIMHVDYPVDPRMTTTINTPTEFEVTTVTGKDRDCPFHLHFSIAREPAQLDLSLEKAVQNEVALLERKGYAFHPSNEDEAVSPEERAGFFFFEDQYPGSCQTKELCGTHFFRREYTIRRGDDSWWGIYIFFRDGDMVYRLFRDIPENQKPRGRYLLLIDPNIALYTAFLSRHWESIGAEDAAKGGAVSGDMLLRAQRLADRGWPEDWEAIAGTANAMMRSTYGKGGADAVAARNLLDRLRAQKDALWRAFERERDVAISNSDDKALRTVCQKCREVFGQDSSDWRFKRANDSKEWPWEIKRRR